MKNLLLLLAFLLLLAAGCSPKKENTRLERFPILKAHIGQPITLQFKRNELGLSGNTMLTPTSTGLNGSMSSLKGTLNQVSSDGVFLTAYYSPNPGDPVREVDAWVPFDSILTIITRNEPSEK
jgi:hypothetical protein